MSHRWPRLPTHELLGRCLVRITSERSLVWGFYSPELTLAVCHFPRDWTLAPNPNWLRAIRGCIFRISSLQSRNRAPRREWVCKLVACCGGVVPEVSANADLVHLANLLFSGRHAPKRAKLHIWVINRKISDISGQMIHGVVQKLSVKWTFISPDAFGLWY